MNDNFTLGELFAGVAGFGLGFEQAGWRTLWQIELDDVNRAVLGDRFPDAAQFKNVFDWKRFKLAPVRCIAFGSPCQDISIMGNSKRDRSRCGLEGSRSGLFFAAMEIIRALKPEFVVFENVPDLVNSNGGRAEISVEDRSHYRFRLFAYFFDDGPVFRFDSKGRGHCNPEVGQGLRNRQVLAPHFHRFDKENDVEIAYKTPKLGEGNNFNVGDYKLGLEHFCQEARLSCNPSGQPVLTIEQGELDLSSDDPQNGVSF